MCYKMIFEFWEISCEIVPIIRVFSKEIKLMSSTTTQIVVRVSYEATCQLFSGPGEVSGTCFKFESQQYLSVTLLRREDTVEKRRQGNWFYLFTRGRNGVNQTNSHFYHGMLGPLF